MKTILFSRPRHDDVMAYLYHYSKKLVQISTEKGNNTINKEKTDANKNIVTSVISNSNPELIMFNGHGNDSAICGHNDEIIIRKENCTLLKNKITYALSCASASKLGPLVGDKNSAFIGYDDDFALGMDRNSQAAVHRDTRARLFLEPSNILMESLLKENTVQEAVSKAKQKIKENISKLKTDPFPDAKDYIPYLYNNYLALTAIGNNELSL